MVDSKPVPRIFLWCHPRSLSTVFERSIRELKGVKVFFEAHHKVFYEGKPQRFMPLRPVQQQLTYESVDEELLQPYPEYDAVFVKDHAGFIKGRYKKYISGEFSSFKHTFLIRDPRKSFPSLRSVHLDREIFLEEYGVRELYDMYKTVKEGIDPNPVIVDADDLLNNPKEIMRSYCNATGLVYTDDMLTWTPGIVEDWKKVNPHYMIFHKAAMFSSGFTKPTDSTSPPMNIDELPTDVKEILQDAMTCYQEMHSARMKI